jgi:hypothetical protein
LQNKQVNVVARGSRFFGPWGFLEDFLRLPCSHQFQLFDNIGGFLTMLQLTVQIETAQAIVN